MKTLLINKQSLLYILLLVFSVNLVAQNATVTISQDNKIPEILELKKSMEKDNKLAVGYTIQLYYGEHKKANEILQKYRYSYNAWPASIEYETPNYKVWVGNFSSRLKADRARLEISKKFPAAFILKPDRG